MSATRAIHPIKNCPEDILKIIFEITVRIDEEYRERGPPQPRNQAATLASICSAWRMIAISTPKLWNNAVFSMDRPSTVTQPYWENTVTRVKGVPATIKIKGYRRSPMTQLSALKIPPSMTIKRLDLDFQYAAYAGSFPEEWKAHPFEVIHINVHAISSDKIECRQFLGQARAFHLKGNHFLTIDSGGTQNSPLTCLSLTWVVHIDLEQLLMAFPSLETLEVLVGCTVRPLSKVVTARKVRKLAVWGGLGEDLTWLAKVHFPRLYTLSARGQYFPLDDIRAFLSLHRTVMLLCIAYFFDPSELDDLLNYAQQGSSLTYVISESRRMDIITSTRPFFVLPILKIVQLGEAMELTDFEELVKGRCLPPHHPESRVLDFSHVIKQLYISKYTKTRSKFQGFNSRLYREATRSVVEDPTVGEVTCLTWS